ncbi:MAG: nucleotidyltransferase family protein, partial [Myxococcota bacterium]
KKNIANHKPIKKPLTIIDPYGLSDLFDGIVRPVQPELADKVRQRTEENRWQRLYPQLRVAT